MAVETVNWKFVLANSSDMSRIGDIRQARSRQLELVHNKAGSCSFTVPMEHELFADVKPIKHCIIAFRNSVAKWSGPIWTIDDQSAAGRISISAVGWFALLEKRLLRQNVSYGPLDGSGVPTEITGGSIVFVAASGTPGTPTYFPGGLLTQANAQQNTWISAGTNSDQMLRKISYEKGQSIGAAISDLAEVEAGFDFMIDPLTRAMNIKNWNEYADDSDSAVFGFNWGPNNLSDAPRQIDASTMANRFTALGKFGGGLAEDIPAQQEYQLFEEITSIGDVVDPNVLLGYAGGEVILRARPRILYSLSPFPWTKGRSPQPFVDYDLGSVVTFSARKPPRLMVDKQRVRVFSIGVQITDEGNEKISDLSVVPG